MGQKPKHKNSRPVSQKKVKGGNYISPIRRGGRGKKGHVTAPKPGHRSGGGGGMEQGVDLKNKKERETRRSVLTTKESRLPLGVS